MLASRQLLLKTLKGGKRIFCNTWIRFRLIGNWRMVVGSVCFSCCTKQLWWEPISICHTISLSLSLSVIQISRIERVSCSFYRCVLICVDNYKALISVFLLQNKTKKKLNEWDKQIAFCSFSVSRWFASTVHMRCDVCYMFVLFYFT